MIGWIGYVSQHMQSLLGAIKLIVLCVQSYVEHDILMLKLGRLLYKKGV